MLVHVRGDPMAIGGLVDPEQDIEADLGLLADNRAHSLGDTRRELGLVEGLAAQTGAEEGFDALWTGEAADVRG